MVHNSGKYDYFRRKGKEPVRATEASTECHWEREYSWQNSDVMLSSVGFCCSHSLNMSVSGGDPIGDRFCFLQFTSLGNQEHHMKAGGAWVSGLEDHANE